MASFPRAPGLAVDFERILSPECTISSLAASSKKRALEKAGALLASRFPELDSDEVFGGLMARERLGSTAVGEGVAVPHCRIENCSTPVAALVRLSEQVDFDASDGTPVDLLFILVVPLEAHDTHLQLLASMARALNEPDYRAALRAAQGDLDLFQAAIYSLPKGARDRGAATA